jgi:ABC-type transport system involved in multi-copper enzyme maturation permease subunit
MTIREKGYHHWDGQFLERRHPWWPITRLGIRLTFKRKFFKFIFSSSLLPAVVFLAGIYISERLEDFRGMVRTESLLLNISAKYFGAYLTADFLLFMAVIILVFCAAGLVADDLKYNTLQLYFARPLRKRDYLLGKASVVFFFLFLLTLVPGLLLVIFKLIFSGSFRLLRENPWLPLAVLAYSLLFTLFLTAYALLLSSLSRNARAVSLLIFGVYLFSDMLFNILYGIFHSPYLGLLSMRTNLKLLAVPLFGLKPPLGLPWGYSAALLAAVVALAAVVLVKKVKGVSVIR